MNNILISGSYNAFYEGFNGVGVYLASGIIPSSSFERPIYFGSSNDLKSRIVYNHIPELLTNNHYNKPLQYYFNKHGQDNLIWFLIEVTTTDDCLSREQFYLDTERPFVDEGRGFNIAHNATSPMLGRKHTQESREKIGKARSGINNNNFGKKLSSERKRKMWEGKCKSLQKFIVKNENGEIFKICTSCGLQKPFNDFCYMKSKDRYTAECLTCRNGRNKVWTSDNKGKRSESIKKWRHDNKDHIREYDKNYDKEFRRNNREKVLQKQRIYREKNKERVKLYHQQYYLKHKKDESV